MTALSLTLNRHPLLSRIVIAVTAFVLLLLAGAAFAGAPVDLRDTPESAGPQITLGDLFEGAGAASNVSVATVNDGARSMVLDAGEVQRIAHMHGLDWANPSGYRRLVVAMGESPERQDASAPVRAGKTVDALTFARNLAAGEVIRPEDVLWTKVQAHLVPADAPGDPSQVIGLSTRHTEREGLVVASRDLIAQKVIKKDEIVAVIYDVDGVTLKLQGKAMADAAVGDVVQVLNTQSKKTIVAVATGPGEAVTGPQADSLKSRRFASIQ
jgi:flagella basal body P-ring formation protein FlgA